MPDLNSTITVQIPAKPASQSRTLRFNSIVMWIGGLAAVVPDILSFALSLLGDPSVAAAVSDAIPLKYRVLFGVVIAAVGAKNRQLRYQTTQPIEKESPSLP